MERASRSTTRRRNCRSRMRKSIGRRFMCASMRLRIDEVRDLPSHGFRILLDSQLREDFFKRRQLHQRSKPLDGVVGNEFAVVENHDAGTNAFYGVELVRTEQDDFAARSQLLNQTSE